MAMTTAAIMTSMSSAMPIAVMIEFEREHQIDGDQLDDDPGEGLPGAGRAWHRLVARLDLGVNFMRRLGDQKQAAADQDDVAPGNRHAEKRDTAARVRPISQVSAEQHDDAENRTRARARSGGRAAPCSGSQPRRPGRR